MAKLICNSCGEYDEECICSQELKDYDYNMYEGGEL